MTIEQEQVITRTGGEFALREEWLRQDRPLESLIANTRAYHPPDGVMLDDFPPTLLEGDIRDIIYYWEEGSLKILVVTAPTPPDGHYKGIVFYWDALEAAQVFAALARNRRDLGFAIGNLEAVLAGMDESEGREGAIYNMFFLLKEKSGNWGTGVERKLVATPDDPEPRTSKYLQPPLQAEAALNIYDAIIRSGVEDGQAQAEHFLRKLYDRLSKSYQYLIEHRRLANGIYFLIHPHATGRDSSPEYATAGGLKGFRIWWESLRDRKLVHALEESRLKDAVRKLGLAGFSVADIVGILNHNRKCQARNWEPEECRKICQIEDIMYNSLLEKNLEAMSRIADILGITEGSVRFHQAAADLHAAINREFWNEEDKMYYSRFQGEQTKIVSIGNLFPLILDIPRERVEKLVSLLESPEWFGTAYPIPSVPANSPYYDPHFEVIERIWLGPTWIISNFELEKGLVKQMQRFSESDPALAARCREKALEICLRSAEMTEKVYAEFYDPETGKPLRDKRVKNFAWSTLADVMRRMAVALLREEDVAEFAHIRIF